MAKKILCVILSLTMLLGVCTVFANAALGFKQDLTCEETPWEDLTYDPDRDWRFELEDRFLWAYELDTEAEGYDWVENRVLKYSEEKIEHNLYFWKDEIIADYRKVAAQHDAAVTDEEKEAANRAFFDLYVKMGTPVIQDPAFFDTFVPKDDDEADNLDYWRNNYWLCWYEYRDIAKETATYRYEVQDADGNVVTSVKPGEQYTLVAYMTCNYYTYSITPGFIYDKNYVTFDETAGLTVYPTGLSTSSVFFDWGHHNVGGVRDINDFWNDAFRAIPNVEDIYKQCKTRIVIKSGARATTYDDAKLCSWVFTVNDDVPANTELKFWNDPKYSMITLDEWFFGGKIENYMWYQGRSGDNQIHLLFDYSQPVYQSGMTSFFPEGENRYFEGKTVSYDPAIVTVAGEDLADYTALDAAVKEYEDTESSVGSALYTADTWADYTAAYDAATALARDLAADQQTTVDAATKALTDAKAALVENGVNSAVVTSREAADVTADVQVSGSPAAIRLTNEDGSLTINRADANIVPNDAGELWTVDVSVADIYAGEYTVSAMYGTTMSTKTATLSYDAYKDPHFVSVQLPNAYSEEGYKDRVYKGKNEIKVVTTDDVWKVQFVQNGSTSTYATDYTPYVDNGDGTRTWTINHTFGPVGDVHLDIRIRLNNTSFYMVSDSLDVEVVY